MNEAEKFWSDFEATTGEKVLVRSIGIWHEEGNPRGLWGIAILTDKAFRFKYLPSQNLLLGMFRGPSGKGPERAEVDIAAPLETISSLREEKRGFFGRIFGDPFRRIELAWQEREGEVKAESFSIDPSGGLLDKLRRAISDRAEGNQDVV